MFTSAAAAFSLLLAVMEALFAFFPWTVLPLVSDLACGATLLFIIAASIVEATLRSPDLLKTAA